MYLYPRLPASVALELLAERQDVTPSDRARFATFSHPLATFAATGGSVVPRNHLEGVRRQVLSVAESAGFPNDRGLQAAREFDQRCGGVLHRTMAIVPADAGEPGVWTFLTCVLLPEITPWRFSADPEERYISRVRNSLGRLWWRAEVLGDTADSWAARLGEDILVQVMERPSLSGDPVVAQALCRELSVAAPVSGIPAPELLRDAIKRVLRLSAFISLSALDESSLSGVLSECFLASRLALRPDGSSDRSSSD
jgi:hypothetical protein